MPGVSRLMNADKWVLCLNYGILPKGVGDDDRKTGCGEDKNKKSLPFHNRSVAGLKKQANKILRHRSNQQSNKACRGS